MIVYENMHSKINYSEDSNTLELIWLSGTSDMTDHDFKIVNEKFANAAVEKKAANLYVNLRDFKHTFSDSLASWREEVILPKYHEAGVTKFAFLHHPEFEAPPSRNHKENFETKHFGSDEDAKKWFSSLT